MKWLLFALPAAALSLSTCRLIANGLARRYPALTIWMAYMAISMLVLLPFGDTRTAAYRNAWIVRQSLSLLVQFYALWELTNLILEHYPGLRRFSATGLFGLVAVAAMAATAGESFDKPVRLVYALQAGWTISMLLYVVCLVGLATYLDPRRRLNVLRHERIFAAAAACVGCGSLLAVYRPGLVKVLDGMNMVVGVVFPLLWLRLKPEGEVDRRPMKRVTGGGDSLDESHARLERLERLVTRSDD